MNRNLKWITAPAQGAYYIATGIWGVVGLDSFQAVTGSKTDLWLVRTVGALVAVIGAALVMAVARRRISGEIVLLGAGTALALVCIEIPYVLIGRISPVYLADALLECLFIAGWFMGRMS